ncbi:hypothetical protein T265_03217 [Opisthorchis viverrini]|uniref:Uncharacterized protein n=1 Tax=Opisthorchis viverrini TaxID=6198 RepID=A0A075A468_OPIVI|nr:hypothetical protein T265_03217 [Opisthorchis viverrini]KER30385.1 hypothetical protein T265_03217 [Opisthorchis viverrini]
MDLFTGVKYDTCSILCQTNNKVAKKVTSGISPFSGYKKGHQSRIPEENVAERTTDCGLSEHPSYLDFYRAREDIQYSDQRIDEIALTHPAWFRIDFPPLLLDAFQHRAVSRMFSGEQKIEGNERNLKDMEMKNQRPSTLLS